MSNDAKIFSDPTYLLEAGIIINEKWEIQSPIAKGGKGEVYLARQLNLDRLVALKIISREFINSLEGDEEEIISETMRFNREVQVMARMQHPNILQVYDFDQLEMDGMKVDYIVMEYVPGPTLRRTMPEKGLGHDKNKVKKWLKTYFLPILDGMRAVHDKGVVHRDMKPENVLIDDGRPKIMDFGVARSYHMDSVTQTHHMLGTITYMPEEQFMDLALTDVRVDVYALGKILYEVIEGKLKKGPDKPFHRVALNQPETSFFKTLDQVIQQATAKDRNQRIPSVKYFHDSLKELVMDSEEKKLPASSRHNYWKYLFAASIAVIVIFVSAVTIYYNPEELTQDGNYIQKRPEIQNIAAGSFSLPDFKFKKPRPTPKPNIDKTKRLPDKIIARDNMTMILLTGAKVAMPVDDPTLPGRKQIKKNIFVKTFYMDKTKITNYLYAEFLNEVDGIEVKNKTILRNGKLLLLLGEVREGYEPIIFKEGKFIVNPEDVSKPVVRVTPVGALAYASFYGKSLPLMEQWWLAVQTSHDKTSHKNISSVSQPQMKTMDGERMMQDQSFESEHLNLSQITVIQHVTRTTAGSAGIYGLAENVNEWVLYFPPESSPAFHIHGGIGELDSSNSYVERHSWEAFSTVGFRTVLNLDGKNSMALKDDKFVKSKTDA